MSQALKTRETLAFHLLPGEAGRDQFRGYWRGQLRYSPIRRDDDGCVDVLAEREPQRNPVRVLPLPG